MKAIKDPLNKTQLLNTLAEETKLPRKDVASVLESLTEVMSAHLGVRGAGKFTLPGLMKITVVKKPKQAARKGVPNPFRPGELMDTAAKPASKRVKVAPLKALKDMV